MSWCCMVTNLTWCVFFRKGNSTDKISWKASPKRTISANMFNIGRSWEIICATLQRVTDGWKRDGIDKYMRWVGTLFKKCINSHSFSAKADGCVTYCSPKKTECHRRMFPWVMKLLYKIKIKWVAYQLPEIKLKEWAADLIKETDQPHVFDNVFINSIKGSSGSQTCNLVLQFYL